MGLIVARNNDTMKGDYMFADTILAMFASLLLTASFFVFILVNKTWAITVFVLCLFLGFLANAHHAVEYLVASIIVIPIAVGLRSVIRNIRARKQA